LPAAPAKGASSPPCEGHAHCAAELAALDQTAVRTYGEFLNVSYAPDAEAAVSSVAPTAEPWPQVARLGGRAHLSGAGLDIATRRTSTAELYGHPCGSKTIERLRGDQAWQCCGSKRTLHARGGAARLTACLSRATEASEGQSAYSRLARTNRKLYWEAISSWLGRARARQPRMPPMVRPDGSVAYTDKEQQCAFARHFSSTGKMPAAEDAQYNVAARAAQLSEYDELLAILKGHEQLRREQRLALDRCIALSAAHPGDAAAVAGAHLSLHLYAAALGLLSQHESLFDLDRPIDEDEFVGIVLALKPHKAADATGIRSDHLLHMVLEAAPASRAALPAVVAWTSALNRLLETETSPRCGCGRWHTACIRGSATQRDRDSPIVVANRIQAIIHQRLDRIAEAHEYGWRCGRDREHAIATVPMLTE
jgi:hypothetical protein